MIVQPIMLNSVLKAGMINGRKVKVYRNFETERVKLHEIGVIRLKSYENNWTDCYISFDIFTSKTM